MRQVGNLFFVVFLALVFFTIESSRSADEKEYPVKLRYAWKEGYEYRYRCTSFGPEQTQRGRFKIVIQTLLCDNKNCTLAVQIPKLSPVYVQFVSVNRRGETVPGSMRIGGDYRLPSRGEKDAVRRFRRAAGALRMYPEDELLVLPERPVEAGAVMHSRRQKHTVQGYSQKNAQVLKIETVVHRSSPEEVPQRKRLRYFNVDLVSVFRNAASDKNKQVRQYAEKKLKYLKKHRAKNEDSGDH